MLKPSLQQFLDSRTQLLEAVKHNPVIALQYQISKYSKIVLLSEDNTSVEINFKPKMTFSILWKYQLNESCDVDLTNRQLQSVSIDGTRYTSFCNKSAIQIERWLKANTLSQ